MASPLSPSSEIVLYTTADGKIRIDTVVKNETLWLTQAKMAELFGVHVPAISKHLGHIFEEPTPLPAIGSGIVLPITARQGIFNAGF